MFCDQCPGYLAAVQRVAERFVFGTVSNKLVKNAIISINNATDGDPDGPWELRGQHGLISSLTCFERAIVQDMLINDATITKTSEGFVLRGHLIESDTRLSAVRELIGAGYLEEDGDKVRLSCMFDAKEKLYRNASLADEIARLRARFESRRQEPKHDITQDVFRYCPLCGAFYAGQTRGIPSHFHCANGHHWYWCPVHDCHVVTGPQDRAPRKGCRCEAGQPVDNPAPWRTSRTASSTSRLTQLYERHFPPEDRSAEHYAAWQDSLTLPMARTAAYDIIRHCPHCQCVLHDGPRYYEHCDDCGYDVDFPGGRERLKDGEWAPIPEDDPRLILHRERTAAKLTAFEKMWRKATKTQGEKEDEEAERLLRPEPKQKPPRHDLRREQMNTDTDKDTESAGADKDKDLSLNYKRIALRWLAAAGEHKPGEVWQTESGWAGQNPDGVSHTFKDKTKAEAYAKGQAEAPEDEGEAAPEEEQSPETTPQPEKPKKKPKPRKDPEQVRFDRKVQREVKNLRAERKGVKDAKAELRQAKKDLKEARAELKATQKGTPGYVIAKDTVDTAKELVDQAQEQLDTATESFEATKKRVEEIKSERVERYPDSNTELGRIRLLLREFDQTSDDDNDGSMRAETLEDKLSKYDVASQEQAASAFQKESTSLAHQELTPELVQEIVAAEKQLKKKGLSAEVFGELTARVMFGHSILANPTKVSPMRGVEVDGAEQAEIARDSYSHFSKLNPELRANAFRQAVAELKKHPDDSPDSVHLSRVIDGLYLASVAAGDDASVREVNGQRPIPEPSGIFKALVKMQKGNDSFEVESGDLVDLMSTEFYGPKGRAALRTRISELDDNDLTNLFTGGDQELDRMIQDALSKMTEPWQRELLQGLMQDLTLDSMTTQHAILTSQAEAEEGPETLKNQGTRPMPKTPEEMDYTLTDFRRRVADAASDEMEALLVCLRGHKDSETARQACQEKANAYRIKSHAGFLQLVTDEFGIRDELDPFLVQLRTMLDRQDLAELDFKFVSEGAKTAFTRKTVRAVQSSAYTEDIKARG